MNNDVYYLMSQEFLSDRLGISPNRENIEKFMKCIQAFESDVMSASA